LRFGSVAVLLAGALLSNTARAVDDKVSNAAACLPGAATLWGGGGSWYPSPGGHQFSPSQTGADAVCPILRDNPTAALGQVWVRVRPFDNQPLSCAVHSVSSTGYGGGWDSTGTETTSGWSAQTLNFSSADMAIDNYSGGSYAVVCESLGTFSVYSVRWNED